MIQSNRIIYAIDAFLGFFVTRILCLLERIAPSPIKKKMKSLEQHKVAVHNVLGLTFFNALGGVLILITQVKLANVMGAAIYGLYSYYLAIGEVGANFVRYGRQKTMTRDLVQFPEKEKFLIPNTFLLGCLNLLVYTIIVLVFHEQLDADISWAYLLLVVAPCLMSLDFQPVYESHQLMSWHSIYYLIQKAIFLLFVWLVIVWASGVSLTAVGVILFCSWLLVLCMQYKEVIGGLGIRVFRSFSLRNLFYLYRTNFLIALSCMFGIAYGPAIRLILNNYVDSKAVGVYAAGLQVFLMSQFIVNQIGRVGNPMMAAVGKADCSPAKRRLFVRRYLFVMLLCAMPFAVLLFSCPEWIAHTFFTAEYAGLADILPILACYLVALAIGVVYTQFLISMRKDRVYFIIFVSAAVITIPVAFLLIPLYGLVGATLALCAPHSVGCLCYFISARKYLKS